LQKLSWSDLRHYHALQDYPIIVGRVEMSKHDASAATAAEERLDWLRNSVREQQPGAVDAAWSWVTEPSQLARSDDRRLTWNHLSMVANSNGLELHQAMVAERRY
jgi:hypothetical protein